MMLFFVSMYCAWWYSLCSNSRFIMLLWL